MRVVVKPVLICPVVRAAIWAVPKRNSWVAVTACSCAVVNTATSSVDRYGINVGSKSANCAVLKPWETCAVVSAAIWLKVSATSCAVVKPRLICAVVKAATWLALRLAA